MSPFKTTVKIKANKSRLFNRHGSKAETPCSLRAGVLSFSLVFAIHESIVNIG